MSEHLYRFTTVRHVLEYYMENRGFHAESWSDLVRMTKVFIDIMGNKKLKELRPEHFNAYMSGRSRGSFGARPAKSSGTLLRELTHLQTAINYSLKSKLINPVHAPYIPMPAKPEPRDRWLTKDEIKKIRDNSIYGTRADVFINIALATGARKRAIETLNWGQVCFETNMIDFSKGNKTTSKRRSVVPMHSQLRPYLEQLHTNRTSNFVLQHSGDIRSSLDAVSNRAKIEGVTPHVFRHTYATQASMNGVPLGEIARILGDSIVTVEKVYAKFQPGYLQGAIEQAMT